MRNKYIKEVDIIDLLVDWISHWKSALVFLIMGVAIALIYFWGSRTTIENSSETKTESIESIARHTQLSALTNEQLTLVSVKDMEEYFLSEKDISAVEDVIELKKEYTINLERYESEKDDLSLVDRTEAFHYLANDEHIIETRIASLTTDQQIYYYAKIGVNILSETQMAELKVISEKEVTQIVSDSSRVKSIFLIVIVMLLHFIITACRYISSNKIKHVDDIGSMTGLPEYIRMIDWNELDSRKGINKLVAKIRYSSNRRTTLEDTIEINALVIKETLSRNHSTSVAIIGSDIDYEKELLVTHILRNNNSINVKSINSVTNSVEGAKEIEEVETAILALKIGITKYDELFEELLLLKERRVEVMGIAVFE